MARNYYFGEMGSWTSQEPEAIDFGDYPDTHFEDAFEWAADWLMSEWAELLSELPHVKNGNVTCETCEQIFEQWQEDRSN